MKARLAWFIATLLLSAATAASPQHATAARPALACGVVTEADDWDKVDVHGDLSALGTEICRAVAAAASGHADAGSIVAFPAETEALAALTAGRVDLLAGVTPSPARATQYGVTFGPPIFEDSQGFLLRRSLGVTEATGLAGRTVCFIAGTDDEGVLLAAMKARAIHIRPFPFQEEGEMQAALAGGHCQAISAYASRLAQIKAQFGRAAAEFVVLDDRLATAQASIATRSGDHALHALASSTVDALIQRQGGLMPLRDTRLLPARTSSKSIPPGARP